MNTNVINDQSTHTYTHTHEHTRAHIHTRTRTHYTAQVYLYIGLRIPVAVKEHYPIGLLQIQAQSTCKVACAVWGV